MYQRRVAYLTLLLYLATLSLDAIRKVVILPASILVVVYVIVVLIYITLFSRAGGRERETPQMLPIWLSILSLWCITVALFQHIPLEVASIGWASYVFFVPLLYVGAELAADDRLLAKALKIVVISGGVVGAGAIASALLGPSAPALLQPIIPSAGIHSSNQGNIYLAPSIFATSEEAAEQLLIALFAWAALAYLTAGRLQRRTSAFLGVLIAGGLIAAARRTDIYVAIIGIVAVMIQGRTWVPAATGKLAGPAAVRTRGRLGAAVFVAIAGSITFVFFLGETNLVSFLTSGSPVSRISSMFELPNSGSLIGQGPGTSTQGIVVTGAGPLAVAPQNSYGTYLLDGRTFITFEGSLGKVWLELGILGLVLYGAVFWTTLAPAVRSLRRLDGAGLVLTMLAMALGVVFLKGHQSLDDPLIQPLFWLAVGGIWGRMRVVAGVQQEDTEAVLRSRPTGRRASASASATRNG
jgi:hypothetical protein